MDKFSFQVVLTKLSDSCIVQSAEGLHKAPQPISCKNGWNLSGLCSSVQCAVWSSAKFHLGLQKKRHDDYRFSVKEKCYHLIWKQFFNQTMDETE